MAISNHDRVGKVLDLLKEGLRPFVEREMQAHYRAALVRGGEGPRSAIPRPTCSVHRKNRAGMPPQRLP